MSKLDPRVSFVGVVPSEEMRMLATELVEKVLTSVPSGSTVKLFIVNVGRQCDGIVRLKTPQGSVDIHRSSRRLENLFVELEERSRQYIKHLLSEKR